MCTQGKFLQGSMPRCGLCLTVTFVCQDGNTGLASSKKVVPIEWNAS